MLKEYQVQTKWFHKSMPLLMILCICILFLNTSQTAARLYITTTPLPALPPLNLTPSGEHLVVDAPLPKPPLSPRTISATNIDQLTEIRRIGDDGKDPLQMLFFTQDNTRLISNTHELLVWSVPQFQVLQRIPIQPWEGWDHGIGPFAVHPNGKILAIANVVERGWIELWDITTGQRLRQYHGGEVVTQLDFNQAGTALVARRVDRTIDVLNVADGSLQAELHLPSMCYASVNPIEDSISVLNADKSVGTYDLQNGILSSTVTLTGFTESSDCAGIGMRFSPNGKVLTLWEYWNKRVTLWDEQLQLITSLTRPTGDTVLDVVWSPDNTLLAVVENGGNTGQQIVFWDVNKRRVVRILDDVNKYDRSPLAFSTDGAWLVMDHLKGNSPVLEGLSAFAIQP